MSQDPRAALSQIRIVLVEPAGPLNIGSAARVMKNFGLRHLVLVKPQCNPLGEEALQMAVHAKNLLHEAQVVESIPAALEGCYSAIATTARHRDINTPLEPPEQALSTLVISALGRVEKDSLERGTHALIFGPEDRGLSNEELIHAQRFVKIPTDATYSALNLAQAVAVCCYEIHRAALKLMNQPQDDASSSILGRSADTSIAESAQNLTNALRTAPLSAKQTESHLLGEHSSAAVASQAPLNELEGYYQHLESVLLRVEYLYPHTAASRMRKVRQLLQRANPTSAEVALLRGMLRQMEWALSESKPESKQG